MSSDTPGVLTQRERDYLSAQQLGRLATVRSDGSPDVVPVGFQCNTDGTIDIGGPNMSSSQKYRNIGRTPKVALVVDDTTPEHEREFRPGVGRGITIRGHA